MKNKSKFKKIILSVIIVLVLIFAGLFVAFKIYTGNYYNADNTVISELADDLSEEVHTFTAPEGMVFLPQNQEYRAVIVFYPGAKVEYTAYSGLMYRLAERGYICLLPKMADNVALLSINAVDTLKAARPDESDSVENLDWYLAGHSLGGVAATRYLAEWTPGTESGAHSEKCTPGTESGAHFSGEYKGVILCASYPMDSLAGTDMRLLSILGSNDTVVNMKNYEDSKKNWPADATEYVIQGGIHSYFGNYGIQKGDGEPEITADRQLDETAEVIDEWIAGN